MPVARFPSRHEVTGHPGDIRFDSNPHAHI
jgi:hypothetical protein